MERYLFFKLSIFHGALRRKGLENAITSKILRAGANSRKRKSFFLLFFVPATASAAGGTGIMIGRRFRIASMCVFGRLGRPDERFPEMDVEQLINSICLQGLPSCRRPRTLG